MAIIHLWGGLRPAVGDAESVDINATTIRELMTKLEERYPLMSRHIETGIAVSINGTIYQDSWAQTLPAEAEIYLLPRIQGG
ncbi:MAG: molybdopterin synthase sulfur carrier subunit [Granulosicoccus sp.]|jgi:molybdopterin synthase sulfur carrier subunit